LRDAESITVNVTGDCGKPGVMTFSREDSVCGVKVSGDETGLPRSGNTGDAIRYGFDLYADGADGSKLKCDAVPDAEAEGSFKVGCYARATSGSSSVKVCEARLTPITDECDLASCRPLECEPGQEPRSAVGECCPVCVTPPKLPEPPKPVESPCAKVECQDSCPDGEELAWNGDECCPQCLTQSTACLEQREAFEPRSSELLDSATSCVRDEDCTLVRVWTQCDPGCLVPISTSDINRVQETLRTEAEQACAACLPAEWSCAPESYLQRAACVEGRCTGQSAP
jgi:hypothetical protein